MKTSWTSGLDEQKAQEIRKDFKGSYHLRKRLDEIIMRKIKSSNDSVRSKDAYAISNWAYLQSDAIGYERALLEIISLISDDSVEK